MYLPERRNLYNQYTEDYVRKSETEHKRFFLKPKSTDSAGQEDFLASSEQRDKDNQAAQLLRASG